MCQLSASTFPIGFSTYRRRNTNAAARPITSRPAQRLWITAERMLINVEMIGETLMIQHYIGEITEPHLCRMVSLSDAFTPNGRTRVQVMSKPNVKPINSTRCEYTNSVTATPTKEFLDFIKRHGISFEQAAAARQAARR